MRRASACTAAACRQSRAVPHAAPQARVRACRKYLEKLTVGTARTANLNTSPPFMNRFAYAPRCDASSPLPSACGRHVLCLLLLLLRSLRFNGGNDLQQQSMPLHQVQAPSRGLLITRV